jgi:hypothetical protein
MFRKPLTQPIWQFITVVSITIFFAVNQANSRVNMPKRLNSLAVEKCKSRSYAGHAMLLAHFLFKQANRS